MQVSAAVLLTLKENHKSDDELRRVSNTEYVELATLSVLFDLKKVVFSHGTGHPHLFRCGSFSSW